MRCQNLKKHHLYFCLCFQAVDNVVSSLAVKVGHVHSARFHYRNPGSIEICNLDGDGTHGRDREGNEGDDVRDDTG